MTTHERILELLRSETAPLRPVDIAEKIGGGLNCGGAARALHWLLRKGLVNRVQVGWYHKGSGIGLWAYSAVKTGFSGDSAAPPVACGVEPGQPVMASGGAASDSSPCRESEKRKAQT